jgi:hypothetical protein
MFYFFGAFPVETKKENAYVINYKCAKIVSQMDCFFTKVYKEWRRHPKLVFLSSTTKQSLLFLWHIYAILTTKIISRQLQLLMRKFYDLHTDYKFKCSVLVIQRLRCSLHKHQLL